MPSTLNTSAVARPQMIPSSYGQFNGGFTPTFQVKVCYV